MSRVRSEGVHDGEAPSPGRVVSAAGDRVRIRGAGEAGSDATHAALSWSGSQLAESAPAPGVPGDALGPAPGQIRRDTGRGRHLQVPESERQRILRLAREAAEAELEARSSRESPRRRRAPRSAFSCARLTAAARAQAQLEYDEALRVGAAEEQRARAALRAAEASSDAERQELVGELGELKAAVRRLGHESVAAREQIAALRAERRALDEQLALGQIRRAKLAVGVCSAPRPRPCTPTRTAFSKRKPRTVDSPSAP